MKGYDILGNLALVKFDRNTKLKDKKTFAEDLMKNHKSVRTVLEKSNKIRGRLRTPETKFILGEKTKEVLYKENGCEFRFNVDTCYFSPRLASERLEMAKMVKKNERVLVLFSGVGPFSIVIAKHSKASRVVSVEIGKINSIYALENVKRNKVNVEIIQGDVRKKLPLMNEFFDRIIMARPNLKDSFLDVTFLRIKKGMIHYHGFYDENKIDEMKKMIFDEAKKAKKKIKIINIKKAGEIGVRKYRYRVDIKVLG